MPALGPSFKRRLRRNVVVRWSSPRKAVEQLDQILMLWHVWNSKRIDLRGIGGGVASRLPRDATVATIPDDGDRGSETLALGMLRGAGFW